jgi:tRNA pseudouridine38/39 synthase
MAYQKMNDDNTIEAFIFKALYTMSLIKNPLPGEDYTRAGRTDKGVSAFGNVISLRLRSNLPKKLS